MRRTLVTIFATIGLLTVIFVVSCTVLLGIGISSVSKSLINSKNATHATAIATQNNVTFEIPAKNALYIAGIKFTSEINSEFADNIIAKLQYAKNDTNVVGVLLEVDSPGGVVVPSQEIYDAVKTVAAVKPVVSYVRSIAASGAYYSIAPSSEIIANRGSLVGSIGVIMQGFEINELLKFLKIQNTTIKSGTLKDAGSPFRPMTPTDKEYLSDMINQIFAIFVNDVKAVRPSISQKDLNFMMDGRVVLAAQAQKSNLIDAIGSFDFAKDEVAHLAKLKSTPNLFYYEDSRPFVDIFTEKFISGSSKILRNTFLKQEYSLN